MAHDMNGSLGLVLMACAGLLAVTPVGAEEKPNQIFTSLNGTILSGYVSTSASWESSTAAVAC